MVLIGFSFPYMVRRGAKFCASTANTENEIKTGAKIAPVFYRIYTGYNMRRKVLRLYQKQ